MLSKSFTIFAVGLAAVATVASGHPGEAHALPRAELHARQLEANKRHLVARNCAPQIAEFNAKRKAKRGLLSKRDTNIAALNGRHFARQGGQGQGQGYGPGQQSGQHGHGRPGNHAVHSFTSSAASSTITGVASSVIATGISSTSSDAATSTATANSPTYTTIQNSTCVTAPEVTEGPYFVNNELLRQDIREDQAGVELVLDIGVMDVTTCTPLDQALVEIWHCNSTGSYSGFTTASLGAPPDGGMGGGNNTNSVITMTATNSSAAAPTGAPGGGSGGGGSTAMTDQLTFLRGGYATNSEGMVEFLTTYPGYYSGRTVHIHTMVHTNYSVATNGSIISHAGQVRHIGQIFFEDDLNNKIVNQGVYANTTQSRTYNTEDSILDSENADGYNAYASTELLGETETDGILAYITIGVDTTFEGSITTTNYANTGLE
ncbi:intradiol ring-cleavage dioxygenase [Ceratobasidium sp. AG-Ba]|nr:intradiol ring-cleavage dioxygenase [Ceratobasidium sp. AG-Ba]